MPECDNRLDALAQDLLLEEPSARENLWREYTNTWLQCHGHPEADIADSAALRALATAIVDSLGDRVGIDVPLITPALTEAQLQSIVLKQECASNDPPQNGVQRAADPVMMFNGQFVHEVDDVRSNGAGMDFVLTRTYKNQAFFNGPLGFNWTHNFHIWLRVASQTIFRSTGDLREEPFIRHPNFGSGIGDAFDYWMPPDGKDAVLLAHGDSFVLRLPNGVRYLFEQDLSHPFVHRLYRIEDKHSNYLALRYQDSILRQVEVNHPTRLVVFEHDEEGRICRIRDFTGRQWCYSYDSFGDLVAVTSPQTDRYQRGLTVCYEYSSAFFADELQHNLTSIIDAAGQMYLGTEYGTQPGLLEFNRVVRQRQGGGECWFEYEDLDGGLDFDYADEQRPVHQTTMIERNGQTIHHLYNRFGNLLVRKQRILHDRLPRMIVEHYRYNIDGSMIASLSPEGVLTQHLYGRDWYVRRHGLTANGAVPTEPLTWRERQAFGRVLATVRRDGYASFETFNLTPIFGSFPDILNGAFPVSMGARENDIIVKYSYEPDYGQLDSRGSRAAD